MKKVLISIILFSLNVSFAAIPTVEGLFRHANNDDVSSDTVVLKLKLDKKMESPIDFTSVKNEVASQAVGATSVNNSKPIFLKLIFSNHSGRPTSLLQVAYSDISMDESKIISVRYVEDLNKAISDDKNIERNVLYSLAGMFSLNESQFFATLLKKMNRDFKTNVEMIDPKKLELYKRYKEYLLAVKEDKSLRETLESPMSPQNEAEKEKVKETLKKSMYQHNESVKLVRNNGKFYWRVQLENFEGLFSNIKNHMLKLELNTPNGMIKGTISDYVLFDGTHELPKNILIKDIIDGLYQIQVLGYNNFNAPNKTIKRRYSEYLKLLDKSSSKNEVYSKDYFIY